MSDKNTSCDIGDKATMHGYHDPGHIHFGIVVKVVELRRFQSASNDDWHWSARLNYLFGLEKAGEYKRASRASRAAGGVG